MTDQRPVDFTEDGVPFEGLEETVEEMVSMYGGEVTARRERAREFTLPLRRGVAAGGRAQCTLTWEAADERHARVRLQSDRSTDAPKTQRVVLLIAGVVGAVLFMLWPFFPNERAFGSLAWLGGAVAIAVYVMTLRRTSGGVAADFLQRLAARQRQRELPE